MNTNDVTYNCRTRMLSRLSDRNSEKRMRKTYIPDKPGFKKFVNRYPLLREKDPIYLGWKHGQTYLRMIVETGKSPQSLQFANEF